MFTTYKYLRLSNWVEKRKPETSSVGGPAGQFCMKSQERIVSRLMVSFCNSYHHGKVLLRLGLTELCGTSLHREQHWTLEDNTLTISFLEWCQPLSHVWVSEFSSGEETIVTAVPLLHVQPQHLGDNQRCLLLYTTHQPIIVYHREKEKKSERGPSAVSRRGWFQTESCYCRPSSLSNPLQAMMHRGKHWRRQSAVGLPGCSHIWQENNAVTRSICMTASGQVCKHS